MKKQKVKKGEGKLVEILCLLCLPYICAYWELPYKERIEKCKALRDSLNGINQAGYVQLSDDQSFPEFLTLRGITNPELVDATRESMVKGYFRKVKLEGE
jgi:hypothetical protein